MSLEIVTLIFDAVLLCAIGLAFFFGWRLNKNLRIIRTEKTNFEMSIQALVQASEQAETTIMKFQNNALEKAEQLNAQIKEAEKLIDELQFMCDSANRIADNLQGAASKANKQAEKSSAGVNKPLKAKAGSVPKSQESDIMEAGSKKKASRSKSEDELIEALKGKKK